MEIKNAIIKSAKLDTGDRGLLTAWLHLDYGCSGQGFGGYALYLPKSYSHREIQSVAGHFIFRCMEIADVTDLCDGEDEDEKFEDFCVNAEIGQFINYKGKQICKVMNASGDAENVYEDEDGEIHGF